MIIFLIVVYKKGSIKNKATLINNNNIKEYLKKKKIFIFIYLF